MGVNLKQNADGGAGLEGVDLGNGAFVAIMAHYDPGSDADMTVFVANRRYIVDSIVARPDVVDGAATTATVKKAASGTAIGSGTALHSGSINLNTGAATNQTLTLSTTPTDLIVDAGQAIGIDFSGALTNGVGCVTIMLRPA